MKRRWRRPPRGLRLDLHRALEIEPGAQTFESCPGDLRFQLRGLLISFGSVHRRQKDAGPGTFVRAVQFLPQPYGSLQASCRLGQAALPEVNGSPGARGTAVPPNRVSVLVLVRDPGVPEADVEEVRVTVEVLIVDVHDVIVAELRDRNFLVERALNLIH